MTTTNNQLTQLLANMKTYQAEYAALIVSYKTAQENYNNELKRVSTSTARVNTDFMTIPKNTFTGTPLGLSIQTANLNSCLTACVSNAECSGATFVSTTSSAPFNNCSLVKGNDGQLNSVNNNNKTAIIPKLTNYLLILNKINGDLIIKMNQIRDTGNLLLPYLNNTNTQLFSSDPAFKAEYENLMAQKKKISDALANYNTIEAIRTEEYNSVHNENISLRFWSIIALFVILYIVKNFFGFDSPSINAVFWIIVFIVLGLSLNNPMGFVTMGALLLVFLLLAINSVF